MAKGRGNGNTITVDEATKLDISYLLKYQYIQKGNKVIFNLSWTNGSIISCESVYNTNDIYLRLSYSVTNKQTNEKKDFDYKIYIAKLKSNLGKGEVLFFCCPESKRYCRKLFMCYGYQKFKHRLEYNNRIYYKTQNISKVQLNDNRYFAIDKKINKFNNMRATLNYKGKETKRHIHTIKLLNKKAEIDNLRNIDLDKWLNNYLGLNS